MKPVDPEINALLRHAATAPSIPNLSITDARAVYRRLAEDRTGIAPAISSRDMHIPGEGRLIPARLYTPPETSSDALVVYFHGGGFVIGDIETHDPLCRKLAAVSGFNVLSVAYRLAPEYPAPAAYDDGLAVARWALTPSVQQASGWSRIILAGDSAGANLSAWTAIALRDQQQPQPSGQLLIYPNVAFDIQTRSRERWGSGYLLSSDDIRHFSRLFLNGQPERSLLEVPLNNLPRTIIVTASYDPLHDEGKALAEVMQQAGTDAMLVNFEDMVHGFVNLAHLSAGAAAAVSKIGEHARTLI